MFFGRNEIHIQAFAKIPPANLMSGDSSSSTFHHFYLSRNQEFKVSKFQRFKDSLDLEKIILCSLNQYYFRLIHGLIASFLAFCSAHGSWPMGAGPAPGPGGAPQGPGPGPPRASGHEP